MRREPAPKEEILNHCLKNEDSLLKKIFCIFFSFDLTYIDFRQLILFSASSFRNTPNVSNPGNFLSHLKFLIVPKHF